MSDDPSASAAGRLVGSWRLVTLENDGRTTPASGGSAPDGLIMYGADGWMSAQIISPGEAEDGTSEYHAYFGTWSVDEAASSVTHHRIANTHPGAPADVERRYVLLSEDVLVITPLNHQGVRLTFHRAGR